MGFHSVLVLVLVTIASFFSLTPQAQTDFDCSVDDFYANVNYTNPWVEAAINTMGSIRPYVPGAFWVSGADYLWTQNPQPAGNIQMYFVFNETTLTGGNGSTGPLYNIIITGNANNLWHGQVFIHDVMGNCLVNGYPYGLPILDQTVQNNPYCEYIDTYGDGSYNSYECYTVGNDIPASPGLKNLPPNDISRDQKFSLNMLPECTPIHQVYFWANSTGNSYRIVNEFYYNVQFAAPDQQEAWFVPVYSTCSNFPGPHPSNHAESARRGYRQDGTTNTSVPLDVARAQKKSPKRVALKQPRPSLIGPKKYRPSMKSSKVSSF